MWLTLTGRLKSRHVGGGAGVAQPAGGTRLSRGTEAAGALGAGQLVVLAMGAAAEAGGHEAVGWVWPWGGVAQGGRRQAGQRVEARAAVTLRSSSTRSSEGAAWMRLGGGGGCSGGVGVLGSCKPQPRTSMLVSSLAVLSWCAPAGAHAAVLRPHQHGCGQLGPLVTRLAAAPAHASCACHHLISEQCL